ncbi:hypothetical protein SAMN04488005_1991 [Yoonia tamlensis]|uniref:Uncharacterized protein n=1 Tax=Yoonia tamlensis TaxID=390270 RepID=A0A1I6GPY9_9RHOB|nr:hypothetical protein [Yoonia tamlensis]SFR44097.1 hypothetical protein SAMN04488005_1991 [Yoonia tamlensis]
MAYTHPIGDDHPFPAVFALAQAEGFAQLEIVNAHDGALFRLFCNNPDLVFRLQGDPGSAMDRQTFDYYKHITVDPAEPHNMLATLKSHIAASGAQ